MRHFSLEQWADFVREAIGKDQRALMQEHLETGCKRCASTVSAWTSVRKAARREKAYEPPESVVRTVKGLGAINLHPAKSPIAQLLFDSANAPITEGVRSTSVVTRQLLYGVGSYRIDLRMEPQMDSDKVSVVGQILNSAEPLKHASDVPVVLFKGRKVLVESQTNSFGEFHLECDLEGQLHLQLKLPAGTEVRIPLVEPTKGMTSARLEVSDYRNVRSTLFSSRKSTRKKV